MLPELNIAPVGGCYLQGFQWAPTLGGECYVHRIVVTGDPDARSFNGHPPLGVNATTIYACATGDDDPEFQWAPTLGGECYLAGDWSPAYLYSVSMGTHPWG